MAIQLSCPCCSCRLTAPAHASLEEVMDQMFDCGPRFDLGDGATFEDMIFSTLLDDDAIACPDCGAPVDVCEESISQMAMEVLAHY